MCLFLYTAYAFLRALLKAKKEEKAVICDLLSTICLQLYPSNYFCMVSPLQTHALPRASELGERKEQNSVSLKPTQTWPSRFCSRQRSEKKQEASELGQRKEQNHVHVSLNPCLQPSTLCSRQIRKKKQEAVTYYLPISLSNTRPTKGFRARSEEGAKSFVCLFKPTQHRHSKL